MDQFVIQYDNRSTVNGELVGEVYVQDVGDVISGYGKRTAFSYSKDPSEATAFTRKEAEQLMHKWARDNARILPKKNAPLLS